MTVAIYFEFCCFRRLRF